MGTTLKCTRCDKDISNRKGTRCAACARREQRANIKATMAELKPQLAAVKVMRESLEKNFGPTKRDVLTKLQAEIDGIGSHIGETKSAKSKTVVNDKKQVCSRHHMIKGACGHGSCLKEFI